MSYKAAIGGDANSGKSYSRRTIKDGENVFIIQPSVKAPHLFTGPPEDRKAIGAFNLVTPNGTLQDAMAKLEAPTVHHLIDYYNKNKPVGFLKKAYVTGTVQLVKDATNLPIWIDFVDKHMPWIHTLIISDFTHFISEIISRPEFINRKAGGDAFQKFWELAGEALRNFILDLDKYRNDLLIITEYHSQFDETLQQWLLYTPAGKMLTEKFKPESYYDVFLFTDPDIKEDVNGNIIKNEYNFVTQRTSKFPLARCMNLFPTRIPNDLQLVFDKIKPYLGIEPLQF